MSDIKNYVKKGSQPMRPYVPGEDLAGVSVSQEDTPELGGMIAVGKDNGARWYVSKTFFEENYVEDSSEWRDEFPKYDGEFYYSGKLPTGREFVGIVQTGTHPDNNERFACVFIPPGWRGNKEQKPEMVFGGPHEWKGQFAGPEHGLSCVECG